MLIEKEQEKETIVTNLDIAARLGLVVSEKNEELQLKLNLATQGEAQAYMKVNRLSILILSFIIDDAMNRFIKPEIIVIAETSSLLF